MELRLHGYELTLRLADAEQIEIEEVQKAGAEHEASKAGKGGRLKESGRFTDHPGLGEGGKYHEKETEHPLPDGTTLTLHWRAIRIAVRQHYLISSPVPTSM